MAYYQFFIGTMGLNLGAMAPSWDSKGSGKIGLNKYVDPQLFCRYVISNKLTTENLYNSRHFNFHNGTFIKIVTFILATFNGFHFGNSFHFGNIPCTVVKQCLKQLDKSVPLSFRFTG